MNPGAILRDSAYPALKTYVLDHTGLAYYVDKDEDLAARISRRMTARESQSAGIYLDLVARDTAEMDCLVGELTIGETYFFRQREHFDLLRATIFPELLERNRSSRGIRIWSAGCATGAEAYSIAILLALEFETALAGWDVSILATDINIDFLAQAREGRYGDWALRETPEEIKTRCFGREGKRWLLLPEFRNRVTFRYHNLAAGAHPAYDRLPFDLIVCRNVLIYFSREAMREVAFRLHGNLTDGGWLLVGHAEPNAFSFRMLEPVMTPAGTVYRRNAGGSVTPIRFGHVPTPTVPFMPPVVPQVPRPQILPDAPARPAPGAAVEAHPETLSVDDIRLLADSGNWEAARDAAETRIRNHPLDAPGYFTLGLILEHAGVHEDARSALRRAIYLDRAFALAHYHLGASLKSGGDGVGARRAFTTAVRLLGAAAPAEPLPHGDGITAEELRDLAQMHLELMAT